MKKLLLLSLLFFSLGASLSGQDTEIFLEGITNFKTIDVDHDRDGNTYILGKVGTSAVIRVYDSAGLRIINAHTISSNFTPVAFDVAANGVIYVASAGSVKRAAIVKTDGLVTGIASVSGTYNMPVGGMSFRGVVYSQANSKVVMMAQNPESRWLRIMRTNANLGSGSVTAVKEPGLSGSGGVSARAITVDEQGYVYVVGETATDAPIGGNKGYVVKFNPADASYSVRANIFSNDNFEILAKNGWLYIMGYLDGSFSGFSSNGVIVYRAATSDLVEESAVTIINPDYTTLGNDTDANKFKFSMTADALDNLYLVGYSVNGLTVFNDSRDDDYKTIASTAESAYLAKINSDFEFQWVKTPVQAPFSNLGSHHRISWDGINERLWWSGSYSGTNTLTMQEGSDAGSAKSLSAETQSAAFVAVFEQDNVFTEVVGLTISTDYAQNFVTSNTKPLSDPSIILKPILNSNITIRTPRIVYEGFLDSVRSEFSDAEATPTFIDDSDTRYTFLNFSVNSVVEDSNATVYTFNISDETAVKLEWLVEYALEVDSNSQDAASLSRQPDGSLFAEPLSSKAAGSPVPTVGKHWIEKDDPVILQINGVVNDLSTHPGLNIRYVPYGYRASGSILGEGIPGIVTREFAGIADRQQVNEFPMIGPASVTYLWKIQYGVEINTTNLSAQSLLYIDHLSNLDTSPANGDSEGAGVHWFDDSATVVIAAPQTLDFNGAPLSLGGYINGDNYIFDPTQDTFDNTQSDPFTADQVNAGFKTFDKDPDPLVEDIYIGKQIVLDRPARVIWDYGDRIILKTVFVGDSVEFTPEEIESYGLLVGQQPSLSGEGEDEGEGGVAPAQDYVWDPVALKYFPIRPSISNLLWATENGSPAKVRLTTIWGPPNYKHIANAPPVSLISHPPESETNELIFNSVAYAEGDGAVDEDTQFTATVPGRTVLRFDRLTPPGRTGIAKIVVNIKVVQTKLWNTDLGSTETPLIGEKIESALDLAGLGTGYVFFSKARYNPFVYDPSLFAGEALWDFSNPPGPVIPVNQNPTASAANDDEFVVVWYDDPVYNDYFLWPHAAVRYSPRWPTASDGLGRILMSSGFGSESVDASGNDQEIVGAVTVGTDVFPATTTFDPARVEQVAIYQQGDRDLPGYNPNEEHALMAASLRFADVAPRPLAAYSMRENDLNEDARNASYSSDPYVLVQYLDKAVNEYKMKVFSVQREDTTNYPDGFSSQMEAGEPVIPFYPLGVVSGATLCQSNYASEGDDTRLVYWKDHKGSAWAVSGNGNFEGYFFYPLNPGFWWPNDSKIIGDCVAWLPDAGTDIERVAFDIDYTLPSAIPKAQEVAYSTVWPTDAPILKAGETLTFAGGEYAADNPGSDGLPGVLAWAAGEVIFDSLNPDMREGTLNPDGQDFDRYTARMISALEQRTVSLPVAQFPEALRPATGRSTVDGTFYTFNELSSSLKKRIFYDPLTGELGIKGLVNDKDIGSDTLTAAPPAVYVLEPNILTQVEYEELKGTGDDSPFSDLASNSLWTGAVDELFKKSRNPNGLNSTRIAAGGGYTAGLQMQSTTDPATGITTTSNSVAEAYQALGPGLALVANPGFLDPNDANLPNVSYVTLAENNDPSLGGSPVIVHIIKVDRRERYRGAIKVVLSDNVFDENIILRHTGDFGAMADDLVFDWWYRVEDGTEALPPDAIPAGQTNPWKVFPDPSGDGGQAFYQLRLKGNPQAPELLLADSLWFVRYRHIDEEPLDPIVWDDPSTPDAKAPEIPFEWAGAGNSTPQDLDGDSFPDYQAQLAQGWVKRVLDAVNPYEARIRDFNGDSPATYASMIRQFGQRFEGPVALNPDKNVIENVGLIELYSTVLKRARDLSIDLSTPVSTPGITNALLLASTRLADFYMLLGNEAYTDALDPTIGYGSNSVEYGALAPTVFTFQNQLSTQMEEELGLLRGVYDFKARPVYNRLFWNFTKGEGEAAYATAYNISDVTEDGFIDEDDAMVLYPQGHGDAWGHYLTAIRGQYELLNNSYFNWVSRSELYNLQDIVFEVDFLDERKFAQVAAAKAKAGAEIVELTYRDKYVADPESQWQGYLDTDSRRSWGVEGWARRVGQGAYFDWVTANALIPSEHPNSSYTGIRKVDRTTVKDIAVISANMNSIQSTFENANDGYNPLGIAGNTVPFDIDPSQLSGGSGTTHFEQIYARALGALNNAAVVFDNSNKFSNMLRKIENNEINFRRSVFEQDMSYRNRLIEIFGSPYAGTIGSGRAYPAGYNGPDTSLYMYVNKQVREITADTVPRISTDFENGIGGIQSSFNDSFGSGKRSSYSPTLAGDSPSDWLDGFGSVDYIMTQDDGITFDTDNSRVKLRNIDLPIKSSGYTFEAPESWGERASPGQLQLSIAGMIQKEAELAKAIASWDGFQGGMLRQLQIMVAQQDTREVVRGLLIGKILNQGILGGVSLGLNTSAATIGLTVDATDSLNSIVRDAVIRNLPTGGLAVSPGDALAPVRAALGTSIAGIIVGLKASALTIETIANVTDLSKDLIDAGLDLAITEVENNQGINEDLVALEDMVGDEGILRIEIFRQQEALRKMSEEYRALLQKGARLLDEREAYNKRVAELVQRNRYQDMTFRVARNSSLQRYHEAFNLAARYAYLAAKAYDYETNLHPSDAGSAQQIMKNIVGARSLGYVLRGTPSHGYGGLAEELATLKANFDVLKGQLGLNNPQTETGRFSLRGELFRIAPTSETPSASDLAWRDSLEEAKVDNLWDLPEFRRYCRPFAAYDPDTPEPGLVIEFSSEITSRKNFFGRALAGGDNAYDPTNFSTKVFSVGAWFEGYLSDDFDNDLSETPRIYLVPVGSDVMMYPSDTELGVRIWDVLDQKVPVPFAVLNTDLDDNTWRPLDTLGGSEGEIRKFSSFRAYHDSGFFDQGEMTFDTRLVGRSVWNTRWLLIIPGSTLNADAEAGLDTFIENISDIKLFFQTYGFSGN